VPASAILVIEGDPTASDSVATLLAGAGYTLTRLPDAEASLATITEHQLAVVDLGSGTPGSARDGIDVCREIRANSSTTAVPILCVTSTGAVEERIRFLEAGADDVISRPFDSREVEARVEALLLRFQRSRNLTPVISADGLTLARARRTVAVYSPKGGVGTTTIATNVAVAAARRRPDRVVLVDLNLQFGGAATHLNLEPHQTIADVVRQDAALR
jgi:pilus assembly protein CpaE